LRIRAARPFPGTRPLLTTSAREGELPGSSRFAVLRWPRRHSEVHSRGASVAVEPVVAPSGRSAGSDCCARAWYPAGIRAAQSSAREDLGRQRRPARSYAFEVRSRRAGSYCRHAGGIFLLFTPPAERATFGLGESSLAGYLAGSSRAKVSSSADRRVRRALLGGLTWCVDHFVNLARQHALRADAVGDGAGPVERITVSFRNLPGDGDLNFPGPRRGWARPR
jgi:hypothetical protein